MKEVKQGKTWTTAEDDDLLDSHNNTALSTIETSLSLTGRLGAYLKEVKRAGGLRCSVEERLKIAGYIYFNKTKPMSLLDDHEITDEVREIGIRKWGDIKVHPKRNLVTKQTLKEWGERINPVPAETIDNDDSFMGLCLDDRIRWAHLFMSCYHGHMADRDEEEISLLKAMDDVCSKFKIKPFDAEWRDPDFIRFVVEEYQGRMLSPDIMASVASVEESIKPSDLPEDVATRPVEGDGAILKKMIPTLKSLGRYEDYKGFVAKVRKFVCGGKKTDTSDRLAIARYLIMRDFGTVSYFPRCLALAESKERESKFSCSSGPSHATTPKLRQYKYVPGKSVKVSRKSSCKAGDSAV